MPQSPRTRIAAIRRHLPDLSQMITKMQDEVARDGAAAPVYEKVLNRLIANRDRMLRELDELTREEGQLRGLSKA